MIPQLARTYGPRYSTWPCYVQPKLNGVRALFQGQIASPGRSWGVFQSRDEKLWKTEVLQHLHDELSRLGSNNLILDGELYVHGWKLQRINGAVAVNRKEPSADTPHVCFHIFDVVDPKRNFSDRWFELYHGLYIKCSNDLPHIKVVPTSLCTSHDDMLNHFHLYTREGYEGLMLRPDGPYEFGEHEAKSGEPRMTSYRSRYLWKHKSWNDSEFWCVGITQGEGKADIGIGALVLTTKTKLIHQGRALYDISYDSTFKVGTGFSDEDRVEYAKNPPIGKLVKVRYLCLTNDGIPFNPSFLCVMD